MNTAPTAATRRRSTAGNIPRWQIAAAGMLAVALLTAVFLAATGQSAATRWLLVAAGAALGVASGVLSILNPDPPQPVTWGIWAALTVLAAIASAQAGDWPSAVFALVGTATCTAVTIAGLRAGQRVVTSLNAVCLLLGIAGLAAWQTLHQADLAVLAACAGDLAALTPVIVQTWRAPRSVPTVAFALLAAGGLCTTAAAWGHWTITAIAYPLYVAASTGTVALLTLRRTTSANMEAAVSAAAHTLSEQP
jgi:hypothetical protein